MMQEAHGEHTVSTWSAHGRITGSKLVEEATREKHTVVTKGVVSKGVDPGWWRKQPERSIQW